MMVVINPHIMSTIQYATCILFIQISLGFAHFLINPSMKSNGALNIFMKKLRFLPGRFIRGGFGRSLRIEGLVAFLVSMLKKSILGSGMGSIDDVVRPIFTFRGIGRRCSVHILSSLCAPGSERTFGIMVTMKTKKDDKRDIRT
jgi:hypothetical protein